MPFFEQERAERGNLSKVYTLCVTQGYTIKTRMNDKKGRLVVFRFSRYAQVTRCLGDHAADVGGDADHLETLADAFSRGFSVAAKDTEGDVVLFR